MSAWGWVAAVAVGVGWLAVENRADAYWGASGSDAEVAGCMLNGCLVKGIGRMLAIFAAIAVGAMVDSLLG